MPAIIDSIINIIYPPVCVGCDRPNHDSEVNIYICNDCYLSIRRHTPPFCLKCGRGLSQIENIQNGVCSKCQNRHYYFDEGWSVCRYEGTIKELIHRFKYGQKIQYQEIFKKLFVEFLANFNILRDVDLIIPIPLHPTRLREREYNQSQILASIVSGIINKPVCCGILIRRKNTKSQINLNEKERIKNISECFTLKYPEAVSSKNVLLIDDVFTTGITLSEASRMIKEFGPRKISVFTLAS